MNSLPAAHHPTAYHPAAYHFGAADDAAAEEIRNPLWIIAMGMACFFGASALVIALVR